MEKKILPEQTLKQRIKAAAKDKLHHFTLAQDTVRGALVNGYQLIREMRANHGLGILETLTLGRAYLAALLMAAGLKGNDRISVQIECAGPTNSFQSPRVTLYAPSYSATSSPMMKTFSSRIISSRSA